MRSSRNPALVLLVLGALALAGVPHAGAQEGPLEPVRKLLDEEVLPLPREAYDDAVCPNVGGVHTFAPPGGNVVGFGCANPFCHGAVSVWCWRSWTFGVESFCIAYQPLVKSVTIPFQDAVGPVQTACVEPFRQSSFFGGGCTEAVHVICGTRSGGECLVYSTAVGCTQYVSGACRSSLQANCFGTDPVTGAPMFCVVYYRGVACAGYPIG